MLSRRSLLLGGAGAAVLGGGLAIAFVARKWDGFAPSDVVPEARQINGWVHVARDGIVTVLTNAADLGQGTQTAHAQLVAEELDVDWAQVRVAQAPVHPAFYSPEGEYETVSSQGVVGMFDALRRAGAVARVMLLETAAHRLNAPAHECKAQSGRIVHTATGRTLEYGELADEAASVDLQSEVTLKPRKEWRLIGQPVPSIDAAAKCNGTAQYGIDVRLPGMLFATVSQCPSFGGRLASLDSAAIERMRGVRAIVRRDSWFAVVADTFWHARQALEAARPKWEGGLGAAIDTSSLATELRRHAREPSSTWRPDQPETGPETRPETRDEKAVESAFASAKQVIEQMYEVPLLAHATMEPMNATADVGRTQATLWVPTQVQSGLRAEIASALLLPRSRVRIVSQKAGGGFGRRLKSDFARQAATISREVGAPVQLLWTREEDMQHDYYRPAAVARMRAALDSDGEVLALDSSVASLDTNAPVSGLRRIPYGIPRQLVRYGGVNPGVPLGSWRSVDESFTIFFLESFVDEIAAGRGLDPLELRRRLLKDNPRVLRVLEMAARHAGWGSPPAGRSLGLAVMQGFGSIVAHVAEISVSASKAVTVHRFTCAVDCGTAVNPAAIRAQFEGGVVFALSAAFHEITIRGGRVEQTNFNSFPVMRMRESPQVEVHILDSPEERIGGIGEVPVPPVAPALCNAIHVATGERVRRLPLSAAGFQLA